MNLSVAQRQLVRQLPDRFFSTARLVAAVENHVAIQRQFHARGFTDRILESRITARVPTGVKVGVAIDRRRIARRVVQQMVSAEPQTAAQGKDLLADGAVHLPRVVILMLFGKGDADLHRTAGMNRVKRAKQLLPHRHHTDKVVEYCA